MAKYRWGDGKGKVHSISLGQHKKNVRTKRTEKARQKDLDQVTAPKGMSDILRDSNTASSLRYGGEERALGLQQAQVPAWFAAHRAQVAGIAQGVNAGYQKAVDEQRAAVAAQQQTAGTQQAAAGKSAQADAEKRGATVDPGVQQQALAGANVNAQAGNDMVGLLAAQQQAQGGYYGGLQAASSAAELSQRGRVASQQRDLQADKGLYRSQYVSDARDKEHTKVLERQAYGLDVAKASADAADDRADNRRDRQQTRRTNMEKDRQYRLDKAKLGDDRAKDAYQKRNKLGPYKDSTAKQKPLSAAGLKAKTNIRTGVKQLRDHDNGLADYWNGAYDELVTQNGLDPVVARAIVQGARTGRLGPNTERTLREDYGITGLRFGKPKRRRKPTRTPDSPKSKGPNGQLRPN
jgi:hypothetical protein